MGILQKIVANTRASLVHKKVELPDGWRSTTTRSIPMKHMLTAEAMLESAMDA